jgi:hypothetical protein
MKRLFNPAIECTVYDVMKELGTVPKPTYILEKACCLFPKNPRPERPKRLARQNRYVYMKIYT